MTEKPPAGPGESFEQTLITCAVGLYNRKILRVAHQREVDAARREATHDTLMWLQEDTITEYDDARWALRQMLDNARREGRESAFTEVQRAFMYPPPNWKWALKWIETRLSESAAGGTVPK